MQAKSFWRKSADWMEDHWVEFSQGVNPILIGLCAYLASDEGTEAGGIPRTIFTSVLIVLSFFHIWLILSSRKHAQSITALRDETISLRAEKCRWQTDVRKLIYGYLKDIGNNDLHFGSRAGQSQRITVYLHDDEKSVFVPICRYSNSPRFDDIGRKSHPDHEGCLSHVWKDGWHYTCDYPDPNRYLDKYIERSFRDGVPRETVDNMRMKAISYFGGVVWNKKGNVQLAALMVETTVDIYNSGRVRDYMKRHENGYLSDLLDALLSDGDVKYLDSR